MVLRIVIVLILSALVVACASAQQGRRNQTAPQVPPEKGAKDLHDSGQAAGLDKGDSTKQDQEEPEKSAGTEEPSAVEALAERVSTAVNEGDLDQAAAIVRTAGKSGATDPELRSAIAYYEATIRVYRGDLEGGADVLFRYLSENEIAPSDPTSFHFHNALIMLAVARADVTGALVEVEEMTSAGERGTWSMAGQDRQTLVQLKESWHRAYLLRILAEQSAGLRRQRMLEYAQQARERYRKLAAPLDGYSDSIAVLDAIFSVYACDQAAAKRAAQRVNVAENYDVEDLYLTYMALEFAGEGKAAAAIAERLNGYEFVYLAVPIVQHWVAVDSGKASDTKPSWTPRSVASCSGNP